MTGALGVGTTYLPGLQPLLRDLGDLIEVVEVEPQSFWKENGSGELPYRVDPQVLERLASIPQRKIFHGVGFPVGGSRPPPHLPPLLEMAGALRPAWISEHISFNTAVGAHGIYQTGFLLPPRQTAAGVAAAAAAIRAAAAPFDVPFAIETGVNYLAPRDDEMNDGAFVAAVAKAADCDILLDLHNLYANERNGRQDAREFIAELPRERIREIHLAGGRLHRGYWLDAHSGGVPLEVVELAEEVIPTLPNLRALIFELLPEYLAVVGTRRLRHELEQLHVLWRLRPKSDATRVTRRAVRPVAPAGDAPTAGPGPGEWEDALGALVTGQACASPLFAELADDPGVAVLIDLAQEARAAMPARALTLTIRLLLLAIGERGVRRLLADFWTTTPPALFPTREAEAFARYLELRLAALSDLIAIDGLPEILAYEAGVLRAFLARRPARIAFAHHPAGIVEALSAGRLPGPPTGDAVEIEIDPENGEIHQIQASA